MRKDDARKLDHKTLEEMRSRAVKRIQDGESPAIIAGVLGVDRSTVYGWQLHAHTRSPTTFWIFAGVRSQPHKAGAASAYPTFADGAGAINLSRSIDARCQSFSTSAANLRVAGLEANNLISGFQRARHRAIRTAFKPRYRTSAILSRDREPLQLNCPIGAIARGYRLESHSIFH
jgi:hypothetical protein